MEFDEAHWSKLIKKPDWYLEFDRWAKHAKAKLEPESKELNKLNKKVRHFFEAALQKDQVALGKSGHNFDAEHQPIDTIVIHHTSSKPGYRLGYLNAVQLLNIYVPAYVSGIERGRPIWSGHFKEGQQIFWGYHWIMRMNGSLERLLNDDQIGWHAGNWDINKRSIGICLDNDYEGQDPADKILRKLASFIKKSYPEIKPKNIIGHREARKGTICPGTNFLETWKPKLLEYFND